jgi:hypothetical protein
MSGPSKDPLRAGLIAVVAVLVAFGGLCGGFVAGHALVEAGHPTLGALAFVGALALLIGLGAALAVALTPKPATTRSS